MTLTSEYDLLNYEVTSFMKVDEIESTKIFSGQSLYTERVPVSSRGKVNGKEVYD